MQRLWWLVMGGTSVSAWGQPPRLPQPGFAAPPVEVAEGFTRITAIRILEDGRVIVADARDRRLVLATFDGHPVVPVARTGQGPHEYALPAALVALPGDTTWVLDPPNFRWLVLGPEGRPLSTISGRDLGSALRLGEVLGADPQGRLYVQVEQRGGRGPADGSSGVAYVVRLARASSTADTIVTLRQPVGRLWGAQPLAGGLIRDFDSHPLAPVDAATLTPDGQVLVLRAPEYRAEWWSERGMDRRGPAISFPRRPVTQDEQRAYVERQVRPGRVLVFSEGQPMRPAPSVPPQAIGSLDTQIARATWPTHFPPFAPGVRVAPDGHVWVPQVRSRRDAAVRMDLLDPAGRHIRTLTLPPRTRVVGLGARYVYLARADEDDVEYLQRYRWP